MGVESRVPSREESSPTPSPGSCPEIPGQCTGPRDGSGVTRDPVRPPSYSDHVVSSPTPTTPVFRRTHPRPRTGTGVTEGVPPPTSQPREEPVLLLTRVIPSH